MSLKQLPPKTVKLITSTQVITSVSSVVKELIENSLDAGATNIEVKLENHGLDKIEVKDNGSGIKREDVQYMCQKSYTSKINNFDDLYNLHTYGFRGEALNALCAVAKVNITTISEGDDLAMTYEFDHNGVVTTNKISHVIKGTSVVAENLFKNLPVRKQFLTNGRRKMDEIKKVEQIVKTLAVVHPKLRAVLTHNKFCIWQKNCVSTLRQSLVQIIAPTIVKQLTDIDYVSEAVSFNLLIPARGCNIASTSIGNPGDATYMFINLRPIKNKIIEKIVQDEIFSYFGHEILSGKQPTCLISITLPPDSLDVNLEPNKTKVIIKDMETIGNILKKQLLLYYLGPLETPSEFHTAIDEEIEKNCIKRKNGQKGNPEKKLKVDVEPLQYIEDDDLDKSDIQKSNGCEPVTNISESIVLNNERENNILSFMEGLDTRKNDEISIEPEGNKSSASFIFEESQPPLEIQTIVSTENTLQLGNLEIHENTIGNENSEAVVEDFSVENITLSQWSRGDVKLEESTTINSSTVLLNNKRCEDGIPASNIDDTFSSLKSVANSQIEGLNLTPERSVSSQMGCKDMAGFTKYASEMTNKIAKSGNSVSFTKVANELASKWREMHDSDKEKYLEKAKQKQKQKVDKGNASMRERLQKFLEKCNEKKTYTRKTYHTEVELDISMEDLKAFVVKRPPKAEQGFRFLGELSDDLKSVVIGLDLYVFSSRRLQESILFHNNLKTMIIPLKVLESGIVVNKETIGESLWSVLVSMETAIDMRCGAVIISDQRISKNGLRIELVKRGEDTTGCSFIITDVPLHVAFFGLDDLKEILRLIETSNSEVQLEDCRPLKIMTYIRAETIRFISKNNIDAESDRVIDEFRFWLDNIKPKSKRCPHQKCVFKRIDLKDFIKEK